VLNVTFCVDGFMGIYYDSPKVYENKVMMFMCWHTCNGEILMCLVVIDHEWRYSCVCDFIYELEEVRHMWLWR